MAAPAAVDDRVTLARPDPTTVEVRLAGRFTLDGGVPPLGPILREIEPGTGVARLAFEAGAVEAWDSALVTFVHSVAAAATARGVAVDTGGLPRASASSSPCRWR